MQSKSESRRRHSAELKAQVLAACDVPGASLSAVALSFGLNANLVRQWRNGRGVKRAAAAGSMASAQPEFVALQLPRPTPTPPQASLAAPAGLAAPAQQIELQLQRGALAVKVTWPMSAADDCAAWLRELLR
jgi:transposase